MGRHAQANARTLNFAVRRLFKPVVTALPSVAVADQDGASSSASSGQLISTQPDDVDADQVDRDHASTISVLGKRKHQNDAVEDGSQSFAVDVSAAAQKSILEGSDDQAIRRYTKQNLPPALRKCESALHGCPERS